MPGVSKYLTLGGQPLFGKNFRPQPRSTVLNALASVNRAPMATHKPASGNPGNPIDRRSRRISPSFPSLSLASISTPNNSLNTIGVFGDDVTTQANWMISFLSPNQGIDVG